MKFIPKTLIICILCLTSLYSYAQVTQVVAHRGYWDTPNNNQNSITALKRAQSIPVYGSEFDVNMTSDGVMIVSHGPKLETIADVQKASYKEVKKLRLKNGEKENLAVKKSADMVKKMKLQDKVEFISFSLEACKQLAQLMPECRVQYLSGKIPPKELKEMGIMGLDYHYSQIQKNPQWIEEAHKLGMIVNVWTVNKPELIKEMIDLKVDFITTDAPELVLEMLK